MSVSTQKLRIRFIAHFMLFLQESTLVNSKTNPIAKILAAENVGKFCYFYYLGEKNLANGLQKLRILKIL